VLNVRATARDEKDVEPKEVAHRCGVERGEHGAEREQRDVAAAAGEEGAVAPRGGDPSYCAEHHDVDARQLAVDHGEEEVLVVVPPHAVVKPHAVVVHLRNAPLAPLAVVTPRRLPRCARITISPRRAAAVAAALSVARIWDPRIRQHRCGEARAKEARQHCEHSGQRVAEALEAAAVEARRNANKRADVRVERQH
jgi:hypothetical protein